MISPAPVIPDLLNKTVMTKRVMWNSYETRVPRGSVGTVIKQDGSDLSIKVNSNCRYVMDYRLHCKVDDIEEY